MLISNENNKDDACSIAESCGIWPMIANRINILIIYDSLFMMDRRIFALLYFLISGSDVKSESSKR